MGDSARLRRALQEIVRCFERPFSHWSETAEEMADIARLALESRSILGSMTSEQRRAAVQRAIDLGVDGECGTEEDR